MAIEIKNTGRDILKHIHSNRGILWERIAAFNEQLKTVEGCVVAHSEGMAEQFPLKHKFEGGFYTREILMPKDSLVVSYIHKQTHPSFFLSGEMSVLVDTGEIKHIKAPMSVMTEIGTQRVAYMHEDCVWVCVYRTDATSVEEAEKEIYTANFRELPISVINKQLLLCQEQYQQ